MGHGHVVPNPDGSKARCGGPGICAVCSMEAAASMPPLTRAGRLDLLRERNKQVGSPAAKWLLNEVERLDTILCSYLADHKWRNGDQDCGCPACLSAREILSAGVPK